MFFAHREWSRGWLYLWLKYSVCCGRFRSLLAHCGGSRHCSRMSAIEDKPDGRQTRPEPALLTRADPECASQHPRCGTVPLRSPKAEGVRKAPRVLGCFREAT